MGRKSLEATGDEKMFSIPETGMEPIENVKEDNFKEAIEREKFMNDRLTIVVAQTADKGRNKVIVPNVNGINQPIVRGVKTQVKRKYVEVMLRDKVSRFEQVTPNPMRPEMKKMDEITALTNPFEILHDPNPYGRAWAESILAER